MRLLNDSLKLYSQRPASLDDYTNEQVQWSWPSNLLELSSSSASRIWSESCGRKCGILSSSSSAVSIDGLRSLIVMFGKAEEDSPVSRSDRRRPEKAMIRSADLGLYFFRLWL